MRRGAVLAAVALAGCGGAAPERVHRITHYELPSLTAATRAGAPVGGLRCRPGTAVAGWAHVELFVRGRVALLPSGIGIASPRRTAGAYVTGGRCRYPVWTAEPTGLVALRRTGVRLGDLFRVWGRPLHRGGAGRAFRGRVRVHVDGRRVAGDPARVRLHRHAQVVVEVGGPPIRPNRDYAFPPGR